MSANSFNFKKNDRKSKKKWEKNEKRKQTLMWFFTYPLFDAKTTRIQYKGSAVSEGRIPYNGV